MMTVREWHRRWPAFARRTGQRSEETILRTHARTALFAEMFGDRPLEGLSPDALALFFRGHPSQYRYVRTILNDAVTAGHAETNPVLAVKPRRSQRVEHYIPSDSEVRAVADEMGELRKMVLLSAFAGLRVSECCNVEAQDLLDSGRLRVRDGKGGKSRTVVVFCPEAVQEAPQIGRLFLRERIVPVARVVREPWTGKQVAHRWDRARTRAGLPPSCRFHDLRRFHATWLLDRGASDLDVAVQLGHFDSNGVPNAELVRRVYGRPSVDAALDRLQQLA